MKVTPIGSPFPGEHLATTSPVMRPETDDAGWRLRLDFWAGRSLTANALEIEQSNRAARLAWRGRAATAGVVSGLEVALEPPTTPPAELTPAGHFVHVLPGHGFLVNGEDIVVPRPLRVPLDQIPVHYVRVGSAGSQTFDETAPADATPGEVQDAGGFAFAVDRFAPSHRTWAAVLLLSPAEFTAFERLDPNDPCELDLSRDAFADERRVDSCVLRLCQLPLRIENLPILTDRNDPRWRNRLAHALLAEDASRSPRQYTHFLGTRPVGQRWGTDLRGSGLLPWELLGVPLALFSTEVRTGAPAAYFLDRASTARPGALARPRSRPLIAVATAASEAARHPSGVGTPLTWRAGVDQLAEHIGALDITRDRDVTALRSRLQFLPPVGLLPRQVLTLLTTAQANLLPPRPNQDPDRAGVNFLFPPRVTVETVPVAVEDLDAALASSAALAPYDLSSQSADDVRLLVPIPQRLFDPALLVVEQEDPVFAQTVGRFVATRQDWRQRRDFVRTQRDGLHRVAIGRQVEPPQPPLEPGQIEPEPVEAAASLGFTSALLSPATTAGPWELAVNLAAARAVTGTSTLFVRLRVDLDAIPSRIEARWRTATTEARFEWTAPPDQPLERTDANGPVAALLWLRFTVTGATLRIANATISAVTLRVDNGRVAIASIGRVLNPADPLGDEIWWRPQDGPAPTFTGGDWASITGQQLLAPFETQFEPVFGDQSLANRLDDLDTQLRLTGALRVRETGLEALIERLVSDLNKADDAVDLDFLKAQSNIHRIRQVMLGEEVANELLTSPTLGSVVNQKSARVAQETLISTLKSVPSAPRIETPPPADTGSGFRGAAGFAFSADTAILGAIRDRGLNLTFEAEAAEPASRGFRLDRREAFQPNAAVRDDVLAAEPAIGKGFELRTLTIAKRFDDGPTRNAYDYAEVELRNTVARIIQLPLEFDDDDMIPEVTDAASTPRPVSFGALARGGDALLRTLRFPVLSDTDDAGAIFAKGVRRTDTTVLILRRLEFYIARKRQQLNRAREVLAAVVAQRTAAAARVIAIEGRLAEARHDVSVARALRQEEQQRVNAINDRRDALIRDEVTFLAYVRPRTVDPVRRNLTYWKLDPFDVAAPVPACLQRHDEPPAPLAAYVQLFRHSPARWFTALAPLLTRLDTRDKVLALLESARASAASFVSLDAASAARGSAEAVQLTLLGAHQAIGALRQKSTLLQIGDARTKKWTDVQRDATEHASIGDLVTGRHGSHQISAAAASELEQIGAVATCLHAEFAAVPPAIRLSWIERFSQFDRPGSLRDLTILPQYAKLDRPTRRRLQEFVDWLFTRVQRTERDAQSLINDLMRLCLLLASHAPVNRIIAGHVPRPTLVRPGILVPIRPINPELVRVGMEFHVWQASRVVARGLVQDLHEGEVSARVDHVEAQTTTLDTTMRVQFVAPALSLLR
jgi:hypothetical protein